MPTFLHIGSNVKHKDRTTVGFNTPDWQECRLDIDASAKPDIVASMLEMTPVADQSMDAIFSSHNIEHLYPHEVGVAFKEFFRVLKPDAFLIITCPDLQEICRLIGEGKLIDTIYQSPSGPIAPLDVLYGHRYSLAQGNYFMAHKCGFVLNVLLATLKDAGFASAGGYRRLHPYYDLWAVATRSKAPDNQVRALLELHQPV